ncbi:MAG TPA: tetratricopeptide repeat protein [Rhodospirillaceae bacterium]|nr:tetratricopeptide repeat protein [Rhodospirillaceae bacterium]
MIRSRLLIATALLLGLGVAAVAGEPVRPEVGKPLQAAQEFIRQKGYKDALAKVREAETVPDRTAYETVLIEQLRGIAAAGAGDQATAIRSFETLIAGGQLSPAEQLRFSEAIAELAYQAKDYRKTITWTDRYYKQGGTDARLRKFVAQAYYLQGDFANAAKELQDQIDAEERAGRTVPEEQLQLLASAYLKQNDGVGYAAVLEKLVASHPTPDYWADLIRRVTTRSGFADRLRLDVGRLALNAGAVNTSGRYVELTELALQAGLPGEAKAIIQKGTAVGVLGLGNGADTDRQKRLRDLATRSAEDDLKALPANEKEASAARDGTGLVNTGLDYIGHGQLEKGISLIEQGIRKGGLKHPEDAKLRLGVAYLAAGHKDKAIQIFRSVDGSDGTADLARLWILQAGRSS